MRTILDGAILRSQPHGDHGRLVAIYSPHEGYVGLVARSARTPLNGQRFAALLHPLALVSAQCSLPRRADGLGQLYDAEPQCPLPLLVTDAARIAVALFASELLDLQLRNRPGQVDVYEFIRTTAVALNAPHQSLGLFPHWFVLHLACQLGYQPTGEWSECDAFLDVENGCFVSHPTEVTRQISQAVDLLACTEQPDAIAAAPDLSRSALLRVLLQYLAYHSGVACHLRSLPVLESALHG